MQLGANAEQSLGHHLQQGRLQLRGVAQPGAAPAIVLGGAQAAVAAGQGALHDGTHQRPVTVDVAAARRGEHTQQGIAVGDVVVAPEDRPPVVDQLQCNPRRGVQDELVAQVTAGPAPLPRRTEAAQAGHELLLRLRTRAHVAVPLRRAERAGFLLPQLALQPLAHPNRVLTVALGILAAVQRLRHAGRGGQRAPRQCAVYHALAAARVGVVLPELVVAGHNPGPVRVAGCQCVLQRAPRSGVQRLQEGAIRRPPVVVPDLLDKVEIHLLGPAYGVQRG